MRYPEAPAVGSQVSQDRKEVFVAARRKAARKRSAAPRPRVAILMGSANDWEKLKPAADALEALGVHSDVRVISAHRTPDRHQRYVASAERRGIEVFICGAGMAAHLAGVTAAITPLPVLGVPLDGSAVESDIAPVKGVARLMDRVGAAGHATFGGRLSDDARGFPASAMAKRNAGDWRDADHVARWVHTIADDLRGAAAA